MESHKKIYKMNEFVFITIEEFEVLIQKNIRAALVEYQPPNPIICKPDITDVHGASEETGLSISTIYQRGQRMPRIKTPKKVLFSRSALREWVLNGMPDMQKTESANNVVKKINNSQFKSSSHTPKKQ